MTRTVHEILGNDTIAKLQEPIETARGLPRAAYASEEFFELDSPDLHEYCYESDDTQGSFDDY